MHILYSSAFDSIRWGKFELFWYNHHLFIAFYFITLLHGKDYWNPNFVTCDGRRRMIFFFLWVEIFFYPRINVRYWGKQSYFATKFVIMSSPYHSGFLSSLFLSQQKNSIFQSRVISLIIMVLKDTLTNKGMICFILYWSFNLANLTAEKNSSLLIFNSLDGHFQLFFKLLWCVYFEG